METIPLISQHRESTPTVNIAAVPAAYNSFMIDLISRLRTKNPYTIINIQELPDETPIFFSDYVHMGRASTMPNEIQSSRNYFTFTDQVSIKKVIARGLGYAILPWQMSVDDIYITTGQIVAIPLDCDEFRLTTFLAYRRNALLTPTEEEAPMILRQLYMIIRSYSSGRV